MVNPGGSLPLHVPTSSHHWQEVAQDKMRSSFGGVPGVVCRLPHPVLGHLPLILLVSPGMGREAGGWPLLSEEATSIHLTSGADGQSLQATPVVVDHFALRML